MSDYLYAVKNTITGKIQSAKCGKGGKFYERECFAKQRANEYNQRGYGSDYDKGEFIVVRYRLIEDGCFNGIHDYSNKVVTSTFSSAPCETCGCNPKNGGSGICNCTLVIPKIT